MFLGSGQINNTWKYTYYKKVDNDGFCLASIDTKDAIIKYDSNSPRIEWFTYEIKEIKGINWFAGIVNQSKFIIYIPKGSIKNNYNLK